jgi:hypothetical protein
MSTLGFFGFLGFLLFFALTNFTAKVSIAVHAIPLPAAKGVLVAISHFVMSTTSFKGFIPGMILGILRLRDGFARGGGLLELPGFALIGPELAGAANEWIICRADGRKDREGQEKNGGEKLHFETWFLVCNTF